MARGGAHTNPFHDQLLAALPKLKRVAYRLAKDPVRAEDLAQDAVAAALRAQDGFVMGSNMGAWLCQIARNLDVDHRRRAWRMVEMPEGLAEEIPIEPVGLARLELAEALEAISSLPAPMSRAIEGVVLAGREYQEVAAAEGVPIGTIKSLVSRGRAELRWILQ